MTMNKILYHPKEGTTGFFYGDFPEMPVKSFESFHYYSSQDRYLQALQALEEYEESFELAKEEAIKNGEIVNPELLPQYKLHKMGGRLIADGDMFDLPEGVTVNKFERCSYDNTECENQCSECPFDAIKSIRLVPIKEEKEPVKDQEEENANKLLAALSIKEESQQELFRQVIEIFNREHQKHGRPDYKSLMKHFTIQRKTK